jgi:hypothetical protein
MIIFGILLFVVGILAGIAILKTLGIVVAVVGIGLYLLGSTGHAIAGRRHYW